MISGKSVNETLSESMEMYLKTILLLERRRKVARVRDIAEALDVSMSSVTSALKSLAKRDLIEHGRYEYVQLTDEGKAHANTLVYKCEVMGKFLTEILEVDEGIAKSDACLMEHVVSQETIDRLVKFMEFVESDPKKGEKILSDFKKFARRKRRSSKVVV